MLHRTFSAALFAGTIAASLPAAAHFGLILPDPAMVLEQLSLIHISEPTRP